jgi:hypothetical protein
MITGTATVSCAWFNGESPTSSFVRAVNFSHNVALGCASAFADHYHCGFSMQFCSLKSNRNSGCVVVDYTCYSSSTLSHLFFIDNWCASHPAFPGLLSALVSCRCSASVFLNNSADYLVGSSNWSVRITRMDCTFGSANPARTKLAFVTNNCVVNPNATVCWTIGFSQCSLTRSKSPTETKSSCPTRSASQWPTRAPRRPQQEASGMANYRSDCHIQCYRYRDCDDFDDVSVSQMVISCCHCSSESPTAAPSSRGPRFVDSAL